MRWNFILSNIALSRAKWICSSDLRVNQGWYVLTILGQTIPMLIAKSLGIPYLEITLWTRIFWLEWVPSHSQRRLRNLRRVPLSLYLNNRAKSQLLSLVPRNSCNKEWETTPSSISGSQMSLKRKVFTIFTKLESFSTTLKEDKKTSTSMVLFFHLSFFAPSKQYSKESNKW